MSNETDFLTARDHFDALVARMQPEALALHTTLIHARIETAFQGRHFVVYQMVEREPEQIDRIIVNDFNCNERYGASSEIISVETNRVLTVGYAPVQLFHYPVFLSIPLHAKIRWSVPGNNLDAGSLAFPMLVRTRSRLHLRERGVVYCETGPAFGHRSTTSAEVYLSSLESAARTFQLVSPPVISGAQAASL